MTSPCSWIDHPVSGPLLATKALLRPVLDLRRDSLSLRLFVYKTIKLAANKDSPAHSSIGTTLGSISLRPSALCLLVSNRFQVLFHRAFRPSFHLSLAVLVHYRYGLVFSLGAWSPRFHTGVCRLSYYSGISQKIFQFHLQDFHFLWFQIPLDSAIKKFPDRSPTTPHINTWFGPTPLSLVATDGIFVNFFSFAYLDISVGQVPPTTCVVVPDVSIGGVSPFGHDRINAS